MRKGKDWGVGERRGRISRNWEGGGEGLRGLGGMREDLGEFGVERGSTKHQSGEGNTFGLGRKDRSNEVMEKCVR